MKNEKNSRAARAEKKLTQLALLPQLKPVVDMYKSFKAVGGKDLSLKKRERKRKWKRKEKERKRKRGRKEKKKEKEKEKRNKS